MIQIQIPSSFVAVEGVLPGTGDEITLNVKGQVKRIEGDTVTLAIETINDEPVPAPKDNGTDQPDNVGNVGNASNESAIPDEQSLRAAAARHDQSAASAADY